MYRGHLAQGLGVVDSRTIKVDPHLRTKLAAHMVETYLPVPNRWSANLCYYSFAYLPRVLRRIFDAIVRC